MGCALDTSLVALWYSCLFGQYSPWGSDVTCTRWREVGVWGHIILLGGEYCLVLLYP